jgi:DNA replication protein DnaC
MDQHQLENKMRMLKLSCMVETLNMRLDQAQKEGLAFTQFLEILLEDEIQQRTNRRLTTRISRARFEEEKNLEGFDFNFNPKLPAAYIRELATCQFIERKESVILYGPV